MKSEDIKKQLTPGIIVGLILGFGLSMLVGVDTQNEIPNFIGAAVSCLVPTLLNGVIVLKGTAKTLKRDLSIGSAFVKTAPYAIGAAIFGFIFAAGLISKGMHITIGTLPVFVVALYQALLGVMVSTLTAYSELKNYEKSVKYTRRSKKSKK